MDFSNNFQSFLFVKSSFTVKNLKNFRVCFVLKEKDLIRVLGPIYSITGVSHYFPLLDRDLLVIHLKYL